MVQLQVAKLQNEAHAFTNCIVVNASTAAALGGPHAWLAAGAGQFPVTVLYGTHAKPRGPPARSC